MKNKMKMFTNIILKFTIIGIFALSMAACKKDDDDVAAPADPNESELITTVKVIVSPIASPTSVSEFSFRDIDGDGGNAPTIDTIRLNANTDYNIQLVLLDESKNPIDTISKEIEEEKDEHQFFYNIIGTYNLTTTYLDFDDNGVPLGLNMEFNTTTGFTIKTNQLQLVLKHQPNVKPTTGTTGDQSLGETDIEINFPILIQ
jgi:hypothetical protein